MNLGKPVKVRLDDKERLEYEQQAAAKGQPLSSWMRDQLRGNIQFSQELEGIRAAIDELRESLAKVQKTSSVDPRSLGILLEILLLLRSKTKPEDLRMWQSEVKRQGLKVWGGD